MLERTPITPAERMAQIVRRLRWFAIGAPLVLFAMVAVNGLSWVDLGVVGFVTLILWLFVFIAGFARDALGRIEQRQE